MKKCAKELIRDMKNNLLGGVPTFDTVKDNPEYYKLFEWMNQHKCDYMKKFKSLPHLFNNLLIAGKSIDKLLTDKNRLGKIEKLANIRENKINIGYNTEFNNKIISGNIWEWDLKSAYFSIIASCNVPIGNLHKNENWLKEQVILYEVKFSKKEQEILNGYFFQVGNTELIFFDTVELLEKILKFPLIKKVLYYIDTGQLKYWLKKVNDYFNTWKEQLESINKFNELKTGFKQTKLALIGMFGRKDKISKILANKDTGEVKEIIEHYPNNNIFVATYIWEKCKSILTNFIFENKDKIEPLLTKTDCVIFRLKKSVGIGDIANTVKQPVEWTKTAYTSILYNGVGHYKLVNDKTGEYKFVNVGYEKKSAQYKRMSKLTLKELKKEWEKNGELSPYCQITV